MPGPGHDLPEGVTLGLEQPGIPDLACRMGGQSADLPPGGLGEGAGGRGGEGAFPLCEQGQQQERGRAHAVGRFSP
jgi:hypothetical protein